MGDKNLFFSLSENNINNNITYEDLVEKVNKQTGNLENFYNYTNDDYTACELDYNENYTKKQLDLIAGYYGISKRKKRKLQLIEEIVIFEMEAINNDITQRRKTLWFCQSKRCPISYGII